MAKNHKVEAVNIDRSQLTARAPQTSCGVHESMLTYTKLRFTFFKNVICGMEVL